MDWDWEDDSSIIHTSVMHKLQGSNKGEPLRSTQGIKPNVLLLLGGRRKEGKTIDNRILLCLTTISES